MAFTIPAPPAGFTYVAAVKPSLTFILVVTPLATLLVPIVILLFFFSTEASRRQPVFYLNVGACLLGIVEAFLNNANTWAQALHPQKPVSQAQFLATICIAVLTPLLIDSILLTRVLAFYPKHASTTRDRLRVLAFSTLVKIGRFIAIVMFLHKLTEKTNAVGSLLVVASLAWEMKSYIMVEWILQFLDNGYSSLFFLYKLRLFDGSGRSGLISRPSSVLSRIRGLFYIAIGNFVFPVIINIVQMVMLFSGQSFLNMTYVIYVNLYVSIIGVVFATVWTSGNSWSRSSIGHVGSTWNQESESSGSGGSGGVRRHAPVTLSVNSPRFASRSGFSAQYSSDDSFKGRGILESSAASEATDDIQMGTVHIHVEKTQDIV